MRELNPRAWIPSLNRYATGFDDLYYHRQMNGEGEWWCYPAGEDEPVDVEIELPTGLKDKNGKDICEGDIVLDRYDGDDVFIVEWDKDTASFILTDTEHILNVSFDNFCPDKDLEIIGNVHENKELLETKNETSGC